MPINATLLPELALAARTGARFVAGVDEVGRGALAGPVTVGVAVLDLEAPQLKGLCRKTGVWEDLHGVRDSKLLSAIARTRWAPRIRASLVGHSVQHQGPERIDALGITEALRRAGIAGLQAVERTLGADLHAVILDGSHDWLTRGASSRVHPMIKADQSCTTVACASVLAKVERDELMGELSSEFPDYGWESNRGYGSAAHRAALVSCGATVYHRRSWNLGL